MCSLQRGFLCPARWKLSVDNVACLVKPAANIEYRVRLQQQDRHPRSHRANCTERTNSELLMVLLHGRLSVWAKRMRGRAVSVCLCLHHVLARLDTTQKFPNGNIKWRSPVKKFRCLRWKSEATASTRTVQIESHSCNLSLFGCNHKWNSSLLTDL